MGTPQQAAHVVHGSTDPGLPASMHAQVAVFLGNHFGALGRSKYNTTIQPTTVLWALCVDGELGTVPGTLSAVSRSSSVPSHPNFTELKMSLEVNAHEHRPSKRPGTVTVGT